MRRRHQLTMLYLALAACVGQVSGGDAGTGGGGGPSAGGGAAAGGGAGGGGAVGGGSATGGGTAAGDGGVQVAVWTDGPGECPAGYPRVDVTTEAQLEAATRAEGAYAADAPATCYLLHDGTYQQVGATLAMYVKRGGTDAAHRRLFIGQSRGGVVVRGRMSIDAGVSHVRLSNLTFDLTGYVQSGSFNTLSLLGGTTDVRVDHVTFTGDCQTGANGGHVEVDGSSDVVVEACVIEKFGRCGTAAGHQDHGVYLSSGSGLTIRNNDIRLNASRGIQLNTEGGAFGTLDQVTVELNRIHHNGHADYEDGLVMNATGTGTISHVTVRHNLLYANFYSGLRQVGAAYAAVEVSRNTFFQNGAGSTAAGRSEVNLDDTGSGAGTSITRNILVGHQVLNDCYDAAPRGYAVSDDLVQGAVPSGAAGTCVSGLTSADPGFADAGAFDLRALAPAAAGYGAYAP